MNKMEQLMAKLPSLKYLELYANGYADLLDGQRWQTITSDLITFNFMFTLSIDVDVKDLNSFRSPFWLHEKHWFVAYVHGHLFSVPHFAETKTNEEFQLPALSTLPDITILNERITHLTLSEPNIDINHRFNQVQTLSMSHSFPLSFIEQIVDLNRIQHLILCSMTKYLGSILLINKMPNLYRISIKNKVKCFLKEVSGKSFEKIRNLEIGDRYSSNDDDDDDNYNIEQLYFVFPHIEHLHVAHWCSTVQILNFINQFKRLSTASFCCLRWLFNEENTNEYIITIRTALNQNQSSQNMNYTYRFDRSSVHIWL
jgi:hypothetical protein